MGMADLDVAKKLFYEVEQGYDTDALLHQFAQGGRVAAVKAGRRGVIVDYRSLEVETLTVSIWPCVDGFMALKDGKYLSDRPCLSYWKVRLSPTESLWFSPRDLSPEKE
jgi:hypothetical protein